MAIDINIPSQVKNYANLAAFPATGTLKTIFIAEDTNKTYRWTGSAYVEISATAASTWGTITGTLSSQTDLNTALSGKVPTTRTLTINGTTQDLSADRTFTVSTGITIGTTAITSGTVGRVLFEGTGNVVQESANLFWDNTNGRLGIGTSSPTNDLSVYGNTNGNVRARIENISTGTLAFSDLNVRNSVGGVVLQVTGTGNTVAGVTANQARFRTDSSISNGIFISTGGASPIIFATSDAEKLRISGSTGNVLINTTTDAGFKLDVNGTARVQGNTTISLNQNGVTLINASNTTSGTASTAELRATTGGGFIGLGKYSASTNSYKFIASSDSYLYSATIGDIAIINDFATGRIKFGAGASSTAQATLFSTGNFAINTTTDAGYKLDVNGTARVGALSTGNVNLQGNLLYTNQSSAPNSYLYSASTITILNGLNIRLSGGPVCVNESGANATASSVLDVQSTTKGFLPPRMTTTQKNAIASPATGLMVYDTTLNVISYYNGTMWI